MIRRHSRKPMAAAAGLAILILIATIAGCSDKPPTETTTEPAATTPESTPASATPAASTPDPTESNPPQSQAPADTDTTSADSEWHSIFDPESLGPWKATNFGGEADVYLEDGRIVIPTGNNMSGITWAEETPPFTTNYELELEARREKGTDFFCGLTFPVGDSYCSLICGGWGGGVTGLSSVNGYDASENDTSTWFNYEPNQWYTYRIRVTDTKIEVWMDDKQIVDTDIEFRPVSIRLEVYPSRPLGIATWRTTGAVRNIRWREVQGPQNP